MESYYAHGKLLITGEYVVLNGAKGLALPTKLGQYLSIDQIENVDSIIWSSRDTNNRIWFSLELDPKTLKIYKTNNTKAAQTLCDILQTIRKENKSFLYTPAAITTKLEFDKDFGLGSSSTLISLLAQASGTDAFNLNQRIFNGSGYDIACALAQQPIIYELNQYKFESIQLPKVFKENSYFVYLGKKQNSLEAVKKFNVSQTDNGVIKEIDEITMELIRSKLYINLEKLISRHEAIISNRIQTQTVKDLYFKDYWSEIKSLGAWGGDFILALSEDGFDKTKSYFESKGYHIFYSYNQLILDE